MPSALHFLVLKIRVSNMPYPEGLDPRVLGEEYGVLTVIKMLYTTLKPEITASIV